MLGETGRSTVDFLRSHKTRLSLRRQGRATGARWTLGGSIYLNPRHFSPATPFDHPGLLSLIVHETVHLRQGVGTALSIYGELEAWQVGLAFYCAISGKAPGRLAAEILALAHGWNRDVLRQARMLMRAYAGKKYRADLLPLYPMPLEIRYWLTRRAPS